MKALKRGGESAIACPRCGSLKISKSSGMDGWMLPPLYLCSECGYAGRLVLEIDRRGIGRDSEGRKNLGNSDVPPTER